MAIKDSQNPRFVAPGKYTFRIPRRKTLSSLAKVEPAYETIVDAVTDLASASKKITAHDSGDVLEVTIDMTKRIEREALDALTHTLNSLGLAELDCGDLSGRMCYAVSRRLHAPLRRLRGPYPFPVGLQEFELSGGTAPPSWLERIPGWHSTVQNRQTLVRFCVQSCRGRCTCWDDFGETAPWETGGKEDDGDEGEGEEGEEDETADGVRTEPKNEETDVEDEDEDEEGDEEEGEEEEEDEKEEEDEDEEEGEEVEVDEDEDEDDEGEDEQGEEDEQDGDDGDDDYEEEDVHRVWYHDIRQILTTRRKRRRALQVDAPRIMAFGELLHPTRTSGPSLPAEIASMIMDHISPDLSAAQLSRAKAFAFDHEHLGVRARALDGMEGEEFAAALEEWLLDEGFVLTRQRLQRSIDEEGGEVVAG